MDINRPRTQARQQPKTMDGFFSKPAGTVRRPAPTSAARQNGRVGVGSSSIGTGGRQIDGFNRTEGFHAAPRRALQPTVASPHKAKPTSRTAYPIAAQFDEPTKAKRGRRGLLGRRKAARAAIKPSKFRTFRKWAFRTTAFALIAVIAVGGLLFGKGYFQLKKVFNGGSSAAALKADVDPTKLKGEGDGRVNILLLGVGGEQHTGGGLTDTLMVASVDPINNQAVLFSLPRDLWVKMPNNYFGNYNKINAAYEASKYKYLGKQDNSNANKQAVLAGFQGVDSVVERVTGIPIHYNAMVDFKAFSQAVDTVGGITVNAPERLYDPTMAWENKRNPVLAKAGVNEFNGKQALNYVRSRQTSSDFARGERQRAVMLAIKDKVAGLGTLSNPVKLSNLMSAFGNNVQTDISLNDMTRMATIMKKIPNDKIQSIGLTDPPGNYLTTGNVNGLSVVQPRAGLEDYSKIQTFIRSKLKDGYIAQENANVTVLNGTVVPGLATTKADELKSYGYNVGTVDNAPTDTYTETVIYDLTQKNGVTAKKYTLNYLKNRYHVTTVKTQLPTGIVQGTADIVIILGQDASTTTPN